MPLLPHRDNQIAENAFVATFGFTLEEPNGDQMAEKAFVAIIALSRIDQMVEKALVSCIALSWQVACGVGGPCGHGHLLHTGHPLCCALAANLRAGAPDNSSSPLPCLSPTPN